MNDLLRITVHHDSQVVTIELEGRVAGQSVQVLHDCSRSTLAENHNLPVRLDLSGVTFIDNAGQNCLAKLHRQGVSFVATDALTKAVVAEITTELEDENHDQVNSRPAHG